MRRLILLTILLSLLMPARAQAHVMVTDTTGQSGMIVHITPDDDPIAGEPAYFYFDLSGAGVTIGGLGFIFETTDENGVRETAIAEPVGPSSVALNYTFAKQGTYKIELRSVATQTDSLQNGKTFRFSQLVSRGTISSPLDQPRYRFAEFALVTGLAGLGILLLIVFTRRKLVAAYTKEL